MSVGADGFEVVFVGEVGIRRAGEVRAEDVRSWRSPRFLPEEAVAAARTEVADVEVGDAAQALHFFPQAGFGAGVKNIELEFAEALEAGARFQLADGRKRINLPHRGFGPEAVKGEGELAVFYRQLVIREPEVALEPLEKCGFEDAAAAVKGVAGEPDELGLVKAQLPGLLELLAKLVDIDEIAKACIDGAIDERKKRRVVFGKRFQMNCSISSL